MTWSLSGSAEKPILLPAAVGQHRAHAATFELPQQQTSMRCRRRRRLLPPLRDAVKLVALCFAVYVMCVYVLKVRFLLHDNPSQRDDGNVPSLLPLLRQLEVSQRIKTEAKRDEVKDLKVLFPVIPPIQNTNDNAGNIVLLVFAANRPIAIKNHLSQLLKLRPSVSQFPIVVSQDCCHAETKRTILEFKDNITFIEHPDQRGEAGYKNAKNYFLIAQHYKWALNHVFMTLNYQHAIVTEDDLDISEDFFSYFLATRRLLSVDETIWCISAWNDNGGDNITDRSHSELLHRTDFFPGLGWMLTKKLWLELSASWPEAFWDDWLRQQNVRKGRSCVRPEVSRTAHNMLVAGKGSSNGMYKNYLSGIHLPKEKTDFANIDVSYLLKDKYDSLQRVALTSARMMTLKDITNISRLFLGQSLRFPYETPRQFRALAAQFGLMKDIRSGMPRTAYNGVITFFFNNARTYLYPDIQPFAYNETWDGMMRYLDFAELYCRSGRWTGKCDPKDPEMIAWFERRKQSKRLTEWKNLVVN